MRKYSLKSTTKSALISALNAHGFGFGSNPKAYEVRSNNGATAVFIGKIVDSYEYDEEGNVTQVNYKSGWHADVLGQEGLTFSVEVVEPATPDHEFL